MEIKIIKDGKNVNIEYGDSKATCFMENTPKDKSI